MGMKGFKCTDLHHPGGREFVVFLFRALVPIGFPALVCAISASFALLPLWPQSVFLNILLAGSAFRNVPLLDVLEERIA